MFDRSKKMNVNFVGQSPYFIILSSILVLASLVIFLTKGMNYGIDFSGGTELQYKFSKPTTAADIRAALAEINMGDAMVQSFGKSEENEFLVRVVRSSSDPQRFDTQIRQSLTSTGGAANSVVKARYVEDKAYLVFQAPLDPEKIAQSLKGVGGGELTVHDVVRFGKEDNNEYLVNFSGVSKLINATLKKKFGEGNLELRREDTVGPKVGKELRNKGIMSVLVTLLLLMIYIWFRFDIGFAPGAILALFHDVMITVGVFCILDMEMNLTVLAALLTLVGYSINDTIVVYDRVRENIKKMKDAPLPQVINVSINETMSRTIMTAGATLMATIALMIWGGEILYNFAFALTFGIVIGSYSTIYIASPMTIFVTRLWGDKKA